MTVLESLAFSNYNRFLEENKVQNIEKYRQEFMDYLNHKNMPVSEYLQYFLQNNHYQIGNTENSEKPVRKGR